MTSLKVAPAVRTSPTVSTPRTLLRLKGHALNFGSGAVGARAGCQLVSVERSKPESFRARKCVFPSLSRRFVLFVLSTLWRTAAVELVPAVFTSSWSQRFGESTCRRTHTHLGMDALKSAGRAIIKSPGVPRHTWGTSKHESE